MDFNRYMVPENLKNKDEVIRFIRSVFEAADDVLLADVDWCKYVIVEERNTLHDLEELLITLLDGHYDGKIQSNNLER